MKKATNKVLSLVLVVMMLLGTFTMMFGYADTPAADTPITTPVAYDAANDGDKLWDVDFSSEYWNVVDDSQAWVHNNGTNYLADGTAQDETKTGPAPGAPYKYTAAAKAEDDANAGVEGYVKQYTAPSIYNYAYGTFTKGWHKSLTETATVIEETGAALKVDGKVNAIGTEGEAGYVPEVPADNTGTDSRFIGQINTYDLENKTYTIKADYFRKGVVRSRIYFANGSFMNFGGCDPYMPCLGIELNASGYRLMRQSSAVTQGVVGKPSYTTDEATGETRTTMKIVLKGGAKIEDVTLYNGSWTKQTDHNAYWVGDVIPVEFTVYNTLTKDDGSVQDIRVCTGTIYQPADVELVLGIGEYNNVGAGQYYGVRNVDIYKGDTSVPFVFGFEKVYEESGWGSELTTFDARGITQPAYNYANGYEWAINGGSVEVDSEGVVFINRTDKGATQGAYTNIPFGDQWNHGFWEMELTVNNQGRFKIGLLQTADLDRVGFDILPNGNAASFAQNKNDPGQYLLSSNAATLWTSGANSFGKGKAEVSTPALADYLKTIVYDEYVPDDDTDEDTLPQDGRLVRDYGANRANIKITFDCEHYIITLYEKITFDQGTEDVSDDVTEWIATCAIDYSEAVAQEKILGAVIDFQAYDANSNVTIKNIRARKGMSASHLHTYDVGHIKSEIFSTFDADYMAQFTADYADFYNLANTEFAWTTDGSTAVEDFEALYNELNSDTYGPQSIKLAPLVKYEALATEAILRGVWFEADEEANTYDVKFVSAISDIENVAAVGYDIVKTVSYGTSYKTTKTSVETNKVLARINANGLYLDAKAALGGEYAVSVGLKDEAVVEGTFVTYEVTVYTIALDGTKTASNETVVYTFVGGEYVG